MRKVLKGCHNILPHGLVGLGAATSPPLLQGKDELILCPLRAILDSNKHIRTRLLTEHAAGFRGLLGRLTQEGNAHQHGQIRPQIPSQAGGAQMAGLSIIEQLIRRS